MKTTNDCPSCDLRLPLHIEFCPECGQDFCPSCSEPVEADASFCPACGEEFDLHCPQCDSKVLPSASSCESCGLTFDIREDHSDTVSSEPAVATSDDFVRQCPICTMPYYLEDGFCRECGQSFCPNCGQETGEEESTCSYCNFELFFDCPLCGFELTSGTEVCPNCDAMFPRHCSHCQAEVIPGETACQKCLKTLVIRQRKSARTVKSVVMGEMLLRIAACPGCGHNFDPSIGECPKCHLRICSQCQLVLDSEERGCPRCGIADEENDGIELCAFCHRIISDESGECSFCQLVNCPECLNLIPEDADICPTCGLEFEFYCPECNREVKESDTNCVYCGYSFDALKSEID